MKMGHSLDGVPQDLRAHRLQAVPAHRASSGAGPSSSSWTSSDTMRDVILKTPTISGIRDRSPSRALFTTLQQYGFQLVAQGVTSIDEVDRVAGSE